MSDREIERKWLVAQVPADAQRVPGERIDQGYLTDTEFGAEVRLRRRGDRRFLTVKSGAGLQRGELEVELTEQQFDVLWPGTQGRRLEKTRRVIPTGSAGLNVELDEYSGELSGLWVAEVEFPDEPAARAFTAPAWFGPDVTDRAAYKNRSLALHGRPETAQG